MIPSEISQQHETTTVSVGCALAYHALHPVWAHFLIQPHTECDCTVLDEQLLSQTGAPIKRLVDLQGNRIVRTLLIPGHNEFHYAATLAMPEAMPGITQFSHAGIDDVVPSEIWRYTLPSRYCESDKLHDVAQNVFGQLPRGYAQAQAICDWVHHRLAYQYGSGDATLSACDALTRGYGVCRDFAHVMIALCRALDLPARYVAGHVPIMNGNEVAGENDIGIDFHAWVEVYFGGRWHSFDARYNQSLKGRVKLAHGTDAVECAFATFHGSVDVVRFQAWSTQVEASPEGNGVAGTRTFKQHLHA